MSQPSFAAKLTAEFVGTFLLVLTVGCNVLLGQAVWGAVSIACVLMVCVYSLGSISGANFNPAVTFALFLVRALGSKKASAFDLITVVSYMLVQVVAGILAALLYGFIAGRVFDVKPAPGFDFVGAGLCEVLYTFMLCFVVLNVAISKGQEGHNKYFGLAIGLVIVAGGYAAGAVSGGVLNPAVAIAIDVSSMHLGFGWCFTYMQYQFAGAALAAGFFRLLRPQDFGSEPKGWTKFLAEFLGTYILVLTVGLNVLGKSVAGAYSVAASLTCMIYALYDISGAHFNPAVTIACFAVVRDPELTVSKTFWYIVWQLLGGIMGGMSYSLVYYGASFDLGPSGPVTWKQVGIAETIFTFVLCYTVLCVAVSEKTRLDTLFGLAIGACVTVGGIAIGGISGGSLNPAVSVGIYAVHGQHMKKAVLYSCFEIFGGFLAAGVFGHTHHVDIADKDFVDNLEDPAGEAFG